MMFCIVQLSKVLYIVPLKTPLQVGKVPNKAPSQNVMARSFALITSSWTYSAIIFSKASCYSL